MKIFKIIVIAAILFPLWLDAQVFDYLYGSSTRLYDGSSSKEEDSKRGGWAYVYFNKDYSVIGLADLKGKKIVIPNTKFKDVIGSANTREVYIEYYNPANNLSKEDIAAGRTRYPEITITVQYESKLKASIMVDITQDHVSYNHNFSGKSYAYTFDGVSNKLKQPEMEVAVKAFKAKLK